MSYELSSVEAVPTEVDRMPSARRAFFVECIALTMLVVLVGASVIMAARFRRRKTLERLRAIRQREEALASESSGMPPTPSARQAVASSRRAPRVLTCPVCDRDFRGDPLLQYCPADGSRLARRPASRERLDCLVCPACDRGYVEGDVCEVDGEELLPRALAAAGRIRRGDREPEQAAGASGVSEGLQTRPRVEKKPRTSQEPKICPTCGVQSTGPYAFCSRDGAALTLLQ